MFRHFLTLTISGNARRKEVTRQFRTTRDFARFHTSTAHLAKADAYYQAMPWAQDILAMDESHTQALPRAPEQLDATLRALRPSSSLHAQAVPAASTTPLMTTPQIQTVSVEILASTERGAEDNCIALQHATDTVRSDLGCNTVHCLATPATDNSPDFAGNVHVVTVEAVHAADCHCLRCSIAQAPANTSLSAATRARANEITGNIDQAASADVLQPAPHTTPTGASRDRADTLAPSTMWGDGFHGAHRLTIRTGMQPDL